MSAIIENPQDVIETLRARLAELEKQEPVAWEITVGKWIGGDRYINDTALSKHHRPGAKPLYTAPVVSPDIEKLKNRGDFREMREMLRAMQAGELTVSRGVEILNMWAAGDWNDNMLPLVRHDLIEEDSMPVEIIDRLKTELEAARKDAELYRWLRDTCEKWSWVPSRYNAELVSGFSANNTSYIGFSFEAAIEKAKGGV